MEFATIFKQLRIDNGWTQDEVANLLNSSRSTIAGYESPSKLRIPEPDKLIEIANLFQVSIDYLLGRTNNKKDCLNQKKTINLSILGKKLKQLRKELGMTQEEFSKAANINRATYARYETGDNQPDYDTLKHIAKVFGISVYSLLDDKLDLLDIFEDKHLTIVAGGKTITTDQRIKVLEIFKEEKKDQNIDKYRNNGNKLPENTAAQADSGYGINESPSPEFIELIKNLMNDWMDEREKRNRKKTTE
jgi:transcriptional regulator with XRE-family HTH domain